MARRDAPLPAPAPAAGEPQEESRYAAAVAGRASRARGRRTLVGLLDAAVDELAAYGYHGARMSRIARRAGAAHGTLYVYFSDKADLLAALYADAAGDLEPVLLAVPELRPGEEGFESLRGWVGEVCAVFLRHGAVLQALTESMDDDSAPEAGRAALRVLGRTSARIAERIREAGATGLDPDIAALALWALVEGASRAVFRGELLVGAGELASGLAELAQRAVFGTGSVGSREPVGSDPGGRPQRRRKE